MTMIFRLQKSSEHERTHRLGKDRNPIHVFDLVAFEIVGNQLFGLECFGFFVEALVFPVDENVSNIAFCSVKPLE